jgi:NAD(P)-dependent dehydrogenase (short-subunit alcohol dehydrogenase family)
MFTRQIALDYSPAGIRCNVVCPGAVKSMFENPKYEMTEEIVRNIETSMAKMTQYSPLRRPGLPSEIASVCSFLAGDDSAFMTGAVLMVDGGASIVDVNAAPMISAGEKWHH